MKMTLLAVGIALGLGSAATAMADPDPLPQPAPPPAPAAVQPTPAPRAAQTTPPDADQHFLDLVSQIPGINLTDPRGAIGSAHGMCSAIQYGVTPDQEVTMTMNNTGLTPEHARAVVNAAIAAYCPQYSR